MKYGLLKYSTVNIGDEIQSLAAKQFLPKVSYFFDRDNIDETEIFEETKIIMNGWFTHKPENWPFNNEKINPLFISFHISDSMRSEASKLLSESSIELYKKSMEIGCRDLSTMRMLVDKGVNAYFSGCLTLTLKNKFKKRKKVVYLVDIPSEIEFMIPKKIKEKSKKIFHTVNKERSNDSEYKFSLAQKTLDKYAQAELVITSRLHCALPCLAYGTPVIFINKNLKDPRFDGLLEYLHHYSVEDILSKKKSLDWNIKSNPRDISEIKNKLIKKVTEFIGYDFYSENLDISFNVDKKLSEGISIINASKNRNKNLKKALSSWLKHKEISEIILVDWDCDVPLRESLKDFLEDKRIIIIRVDNQTNWALSKAFNLAASFVTKNKILKLDADIILKDDFFEKHILKENIFYRGNLLLAREPNETHLNGVLFLYSKDFYESGGYNEMIKTYGYDDTDLYLRLSSVNKLKPKDFNFDTLIHIKHDDENRIKYQKRVISIKSEHQKNRYLAEKYYWNKNIIKTKFSVDKKDERFFYAYENLSFLNIYKIFFILKVNIFLILKIVKNIILFLFKLDRINNIFLNELDRRVGILGIFLNKNFPKLYLFLKKYKK